MVQKIFSRHSSAYHLRNRSWLFFSNLCVFFNRKIDNIINSLIFECYLILRQLVSLASIQLLRFQRSSDRNSSYFFRLLSMHFLFYGVFPIDLAWIFKLKSLFNSTLFSFCLLFYMNNQLIYGF